MPRTPILEFKSREFGSAIRRVRQARGLSIRQVDDQTGICYNTVLMIEKGTPSRFAIPLASWAHLDTDDFVTVNRRGTDGPSTD